MGLGVMDTDTIDSVIKKSLGLGVITDVRKLAVQNGIPPEIIEELDRMGLELMGALLREDVIQDGSSLMIMSESDKEGFGLIDSLVEVNLD